MLDVGFKSDLAALSPGLVRSVFVCDRAVAGDRGHGRHVWRSYDCSAFVTGDPCRIIWVAPATDPTGASGAWQRVHDGSVWIEWADGWAWGSGSAGAASNTAALTAAFILSRWVKAGEGEAHLQRVRHYRSNRFTGAGWDATKFKRADGWHNRMFQAVGFEGMRYEGLGVDMNPEGNPGSGSHDAFRLENCDRFHLDDVFVKGARGLYAPAPGLEWKVGAGLSVQGGAHGEIKRLRTEGCFDGYVLGAHPHFTDWGSRHAQIIRCAGLIGPGSHHARYIAPRGSDACQEEPGATFLIIGADHAKGFAPYGDGGGLGLGHIVQHNTTWFCEVWGATGIDAGISVVDFHLSRYGRAWGGEGLFPTVRAVEIDTDSHDCMVIGFVGLNAGDIAFSIFRTKRAVLINCIGDKRLWSLDPTGASYSSALITGGSPDDVVTLNLNEARDVRLVHVHGEIVDSGDGVALAFDCPNYSFRFDSSMLTFDSTRVRFDQDR